ncbi:DNA polymerase III subunit delta [Gordonia hankookensis]|uniref:DNA-directed DNA polymerase n=1 Tax=Gordonia hankookensis TaxID=589403 RepID=A0ABR7W6Q2_9ACTN|nr:DNA polymerase III subunit delta [Gordonia hankookensis]MBD1318270.1 DNA polymerase III subunit delta [Gordonia hankookensis]NDZ93806.1 DNA polymerase III subunit delta [Streptomyces sp. SID11726]NEB25544.1 DNA polymerase III subunit delta [Streptomyces sp. SID6673]
MVAVTQRLHLLLGDDDFLTGRVITAVVTEQSAATGADIPVTRVRAGDVTEHELAELLSPSLFAEDRIVVVESAAEAGKEPAALISAAAAELPEGITLMVAHTGGGRAKSMVPALKKAGAVEHDCAGPKWPSERIDFVRNEFRSLGAKVSNEVVEQVVEGVGSELRELAAACSQLMADTGGKVTVDAVRLYYQGRPEITGFEVADKAVTGDRAGALESLAWAEHHGVPRVLLADALAEAVHAIARVRAMGSMDQYAAASELGMPPRRVKKVQAQARAWDSTSIASAIVVVAQLNGDVKGQAADADFSLEHAVATVADLRPARERSRRE